MANQQITSSEPKLKSVLKKLIIVALDQCQDSESVRALCRELLAHPKTRKALRRVTLRPVPKMRREIYNTVCGEFDRDIYEHPERCRRSTV